MNQGYSFSDLTVRTVAIGLCVGLCISLEVALEYLSISAPYLVFLPAIAGACALGGFGAALWAIFFSTAGLWYFFVPPFGFALPSFNDFAHLCVFVGVASFVCWVIDRLRRANDELSRDNVMLGCKISTLLTHAKAQQ
jgi:K+-sensing histidine kinase KdpD